MVGRRSSGPSRSAAASEAATKVVVPKLNQDPVWSLRPWPAVVFLAGQDYQIPALCAADWLAYLMQPQPDLDGMVLDLLPDSDELLFTSEVTLEGLYQVCVDLIETVCARHWWIALRLISVARTNWQILGASMLQKLDIEKVSIAAWLDVLTVVILDSMDPKDTMMFTLRLEAPPVELEIEPEEMEMTQESFLSLMR